MRVRTVLLAVQVLASFHVSGQWQWQNPLDIGNLGLADKYALLYNAAGVLVSGWLESDHNRPRPWEAGVAVSLHQEYNAEEDPLQLVLARGRIGRQLHRWLQLGLEGQVYGTGQAGRTVLGLGGAVYFNWYFLNRERFRLYFDNGFGIVVTHRAFPRGGTRFNFNRYYGLNVGFKLRDQVFLTMGAHTFHLSNAFLFGDDRNPAFDSVGVTLGITTLLGG